VLKKNTSIQLLNTLDERIQLINQQGIANVIIQDFDESFANLTALEFVEKILVNKLNIGMLCMGYNHRFGKDRTGDFIQLQNIGKRYNFLVSEIPKEELNQCDISSTTIREALNQGEIAQANRFLGYSYKLEGVVVHGKNLGKEIGYPTANILMEDELKLIPKNGVYLVQSEIKGMLVNGLMNIGNKPTVHGKTLTIEVHLLEFNEDLYGKRITVSMLKYLRPEQKFGSLSNLKEQIQKDEKIARFFFESYAQ
jgi:riboflavin kinase/FMN adenylyltransferase